MHSPCTDCGHLEQLRKDYAQSLLDVHRLQAQLKVAEYWIKEDDMKHYRRQVKSQTGGGE